MSWWYRKVIRPVLFASDSEEIHNRTLNTLGWISRSRLGLEFLESFYQNQTPPLLPINLFNLQFPNPIGIAAGMDKAATAVPAWEALGFGFTELGGVTWKPQLGNPSPRMFRAVTDGALINRMGFNNPGAEAVATKLSTWKQSGLWPRHPVGINLGKSKVTPLENAPEDYAASFRVLRDYADFFVINVSSPNTPNLRELQDKAALAEIIKALQSLNSHKKPLLVKVAPELSFEAIDEILELVAPCGISGIVATNTTITRPESPNSNDRIYSEAGGLSGKPLRQRSTEIIRHIYRRSQGKIAIIGVGGIFNAVDAWEKITAGASLIQVYTGLVYEGPALPRAIREGLASFLDHYNFRSIDQAVGINSS